MWDYHSSEVPKCQRRLAALKFEMKYQQETAARVDCRLRIYESYSISLTVAMISCSRVGVNRELLDS